MTFFLTVNANSDAALGDGVPFDAVRETAFASLVRHSYDDQRSYLDNIWLLALNSQHGEPWASNHPWTATDASGVYTAWKRMHQTSLDNIGALSRML